MVGSSDADMVRQVGPRARGPSFGGVATLPSQEIVDKLVSPRLSSLFSKLKVTVSCWTRDESLHNGTEPCPWEAPSVCVLWCGQW